MSEREKLRRYYVGNNWTRKILYSSSFKVNYVQVLSCLKIINFHNNWKCHYIVLRIFTKLSLVRGIQHCVSFLFFPIYVHPHYYISLLQCDSLFLPYFPYLLELFFYCSLTSDKRLFHDKGTRGRPSCHVWFLCESHTGQIKSNCWQDQRRFYY